MKKLSTVVWCLYHISEWRMQLQHAWLHTYHGS